MIYLVRKESETPNIQNVEDIIGLKYAGNGVNGVVKNYLNQMSYEINGRDFKVRSGEAIIDGWQVKVDAEGATVSVNNTSNTEYCVVYIEVDLTIADNKQAYLKLVYDSALFPQLDTGDNISVIHTGIARMELYRFVHSNGTINDVQSRFEFLDGESYIAKYASTDKSKGSIEERLTKLGFRQGTLTPSISTLSVPENIFTRQGNYVLMNSTTFVNSKSMSAQSSYTIGIVPVEFRPKKTIHLSVFMDGSNVIYTIPGAATLTADGVLTLDNFTGIYAVYTIGSIIGGTSPGADSYHQFRFENCGWEANPL